VFYFNTNLLGQNTQDKFLPIAPNDFDEQRSPQRYFTCDSLRGSLLTGDCFNETILKKMQEQINNDSKPKKESDTNK
tara:strand:- start:1184 stop:1414 length:231 start_codon:yes stop_codon:yes gene_type:complete